ncbi:MAG: hypothetical protein AAFZ07_19495 [Actinomycetota bacterium]
MTGLLQPEDLRDWWSIVADDYGDRSNPVMGGAQGKEQCVYSDTAGCHCMVGQFLVDNGLDVPQPGYSNNSATIEDLAQVGPLSERLELGLVEDLAVLQRMADDGGNWAMAWSHFLDEIGELR